MAVANSSRLWMSRSWPLKSHRNLLIWGPMFWVGCMGIISWWVVWEYGNASVVSMCRVRVRNAIDVISVIASMVLVLLNFRTSYVHYYYYV